MTATGEEHQGGGGGGGKEHKNQHAEEDGPDTSENTQEGMLRIHSFTE